MGCLKTRTSINLARVDIAVLHWNTFQARFWNVHNDEMCRINSVSAMIFYQEVSKSYHASQLPPLSTLPFLEMTWNEAWLLMFGHGTTNQPEAEVEKSALSW